MKPYVVVSDVHLHNWSLFNAYDEVGVNSRLKLILGELERAAEDCQGGRLYIAGDLFHVRGSVAPSVLNPTLETFGKLRAAGVEVRIIPGNHDLESDTSSKLNNASQALQHLGCVVCTETTRFDDDKVVMIPWIPKLSDLKEELKRHAKPGYTAIIHAALNGVLRGIPDHGLDATELASIGYERILCGHYHNHKDFGNGVYSIGALTHQTWGDVNTLAGYLQVGKDVKHIESAAPKFIDAHNHLDDPTAVRGSYVRIRVGQVDETTIQALRDEYEKLGAFGVKIIAEPERRTPVRLEVTPESGASVETSVEDWIKANECPVDKQKVIAECMSVLDASSKQKEVFE